MWALAVLLHAEARGACFLMHASGQPSAYTPFAISVSLPPLSATPPHPHPHHLSSCIGPNRESTGAETKREKKMGHSTNFKS